MIKAIANRYLKLITLAILLFSYTASNAQDYIVFKPYKDTLYCHNVYIHNIPEGILYYTSTKGKRDTIYNAYDSVETVYSHNRTIRNFDKNGFYWEKSTGLINLYESKTYQFWSAPEWGKMTIKPNKYLTYPSIIAGPKTEIQLKWILTTDNDTIYNPRRKNLDEKIFPLLKPRINYFDKKSKLKHEDYEKLIKTVNQKIAGNYEYFVNRLNDTIYCKGIQYELQFGSLIRFKYVDDYDVTFSYKGKKNCLIIGAFEADQIKYSLLDPRFINQKFFFPGHFWVKRDGILKLYYYAKLITTIDHKSEMYISKVVSQNILEFPSGMVIEFTQDNFDETIRSFFNSNQAFKDHYKDEEIKLNDYIIDEMISFYNYHQQKTLTKSSDRAFE